MSLLEHVHTTLTRTAQDFDRQTLLVAVSGGVDSLVLLTALAHWQQSFGYRLHVATFDHGLRGEAGRADADFVVGWAGELGFPVTRGAGQVTSQDGSLEAAARQARYTFLAGVAVKVGARYIALGHHRDDQIETVLINLLRGTGLSGLRGMGVLSPMTENHLHEDAPDALYDALDDLTLLRPLLNVPRAEIEAFAEAHALQPRLDHTNTDPAYLRNRLRHELIPLLEDIMPGAKETIGRMAGILGGDYAIVQEAAQIAALDMSEWETTDGGVNEEEGEIVHVDRHAFLLRGRGLQRQILRYLLGDLTPGLRDLPYQQVESACDLIASGNPGARLMLPAEMVLTVGYDEFTLHYGGLYPYPAHLPHLRPGQVVPLDGETPQFSLKGMRFYTYWVVDGRSQDLYHHDPLEATLAIPAEAEFNLRTRRPGDRFRPMGMGGRSQKLSDTFTNLKVPQALRDRVPLLTINDEIAWFIAPTLHGPQGRIAESFAVRPDSDSVLRVRWEVIPSA